MRNFPEHEYATHQPTEHPPTPGPKAIIFEIYVTKLFACDFFSKTMNVCVTRQGCIYIHLH